MLSYEEFKEKVVNEFKNFLPEKFQEYDLEYKQVHKVNEELDAIALKISGAGFGISPTIYIKDMFGRYEQEGEFELVMTSTADMFVNAFEHAPEPTELLDFDSAKDNIIFQLVNTEQNRDMLENVPNRGFNDLSIVYRWVVNDSAEQMMSSVVTNQLADKLGMSEEDLYKAAYENTKRMFPYNVTNMNEVIKKMFMNDGMDPEMAESMIGDANEEHALYVATNSRNMFGATAMLYAEQFKELADRHESNLYILPSSIHEVLLVYENAMDAEELAAMVNDVNMSTVSLEERLSNQVYHYDRTTNEVTLATNTPNKRLDASIVAEPSMSKPVL